LGDDEGAIATLRTALRLDPDHVEARIYLGNILYDRGDYEAALYHLGKSEPDDHWDELGIWRLIELKRTLYKVTEQDPELKPWDDRLTELASEMDDVDELLIELDPRHGDEATREAQIARGQLELFGTLLSGLAEQKVEADAQHQIVARDGTKFAGSWEEIVLRMRDALGDPTHTMEDFMRRAARRGFRETGVQIPTHDAESFIRGSADAGLLRIVR
jgi:tetratricopeptide (TPR) repeat protein